MSAIEQTFTNLNDKTAFIPFIMAGDPNGETTLSLMLALAEGGADVIELGMPFTDPVADGPAIQLAGQRALEAGGSMKNTLEIVRQFRESNKDTPVILMGYANPVFAYGVQDFAANAAQVGLNGVLIVDLPPEEASDFYDAFQAESLDFIRLITPTTTPERLDKILTHASGFLYYVSITGVTGAAKADPQDIESHIQQIKGQTELPVAIGFGIKTPEDAAAMSQIGDAIVVGSALVNTIADNQNDPNLAQNIGQQAEALAEAAKTAGN